MAKPSEVQATKAVNVLLASILPGAVQLGPNASAMPKKSMKKKSSNAQLIDRSLKQRLEIAALDARKVRKKQKEARKRQIQAQKDEERKIRDAAHLEVLKRHQAEGTLTEADEKELEQILQGNVKKVMASSEFKNQDEQEEYEELQEYILNNAYAQKLRKKKSDSRGFKEKTKPKLPLYYAKQYPGLTPGLAPVDASDEEESSSEEETEDY